MIRESARPSAGRRSAITIALANQKGGVGKTTTAVSLSVALAAGGYRVLLVDIDPQGNATSSLGIEKTDLEYTIYDLLVGNAPAQDVIVETGRERLQLLPSAPELAGAEVGWSVFRLANHGSRRVSIRFGMPTISSWWIVRHRWV